MDDTTKETLLDQFRVYLDGFDQDEPEGEPAASAEASDETDLFSVFVELAGLRNEVRAESRLVKDALDQFRSVFETLQASHTELERELKRARAETREHGRAALRPLLLDMIDVRDRLAAGLKSRPLTRRRPWYRRFGQKPRREPAWRTALGMTVRRLDRLLADRHIVAIETVGRPFDPRLARVVATVEDSAAMEGMVIEELRPGFLWEDELLRTAEVVVVKGSTGEGEMK